MCNEGDFAMKSDGIKCGFKRTKIWFECIDEEPNINSKTWQCNRQGYHKFNDVDGDGEILLCTQHYKIATLNWTNSQKCQERRKMN